MDGRIPGQVICVPGSISKGFEYVDGKIVMVSDTEVYGFSKKGSHKEETKAEHRSIYRS